MIKPKHVGGLDCLEVLARLSEYMEGGLPDEERLKMVAHVSACDVCERFGGQFLGSVDRLKTFLGVAPAVPKDVQDRLRARLRG